MSGPSADARPIASCLLCGHRRPLAVWYCGTRAGVCEDCRSLRQQPSADAVRALIDKVQSEARLLQAQIGTCEHALHNSPIGCPYCRRDQRYVTLLTEVADALLHAPQSVDVRGLTAQWRKTAASSNDHALVLSATGGYEDASYERGKAEARKFCANELDALLSAAIPPTPAQEETPPQHCCGLRGFADSGDDCPGCVASGRTKPKETP